MGKATKPAQPTFLADEPLLTPGQAARLLGIDRRLLPELIDTEGLPVVELGRTETGRIRRRFDPVSLRAWKQEKEVTYSAPGEKPAPTVRPDYRTPEARLEMLKKYGWDGVERLGPKARTKKASGG